MDKRLEFYSAVQMLVKYFMNDIPLNVQNILQDNAKVEKIFENDGLVQELKDVTELWFVSASYVTIKARLKNLCQKIEKYISKLPNDIEPGSNGGNNNEEINTHINDEGVRNDSDKNKSNGSDEDEPIYNDNNTKIRPKSSTKEINNNDKEDEKENNGENDENEDDIDISDVLKDQTNQYYSDIKRLRYLIHCQYYTMIGFLDSIISNKETEFDWICIDQFFTENYVICSRVLELELDVPNLTNNESYEIFINKFRQFYNVSLVRRISNCNKMMTDEAICSAIAETTGLNELLEEYYNGKSLMSYDNFSIVIQSALNDFYDSSENGENVDENGDSQTNFTSSGSSSAAAAAAAATPSVTPMTPVTPATQGIDTETERRISLIRPHLRKNDWQQGLLADQNHLKLEHRNILQFMKSPAVHVSLNWNEIESMSRDSVKSSQLRRKYFDFVALGLVNEILVDVRRPAQVMRSFLQKSRNTLTMILRWYQCISLMSRATLNKEVIYNFGIYLKREEELEIEENRRKQQSGFGNNQRGRIEVRGVMKQLLGREHGGNKEEKKQPKGIYDSETDKDNGQSREADKQARLDYQTAKDYKRKESKKKKAEVDKYIKKERPEQYDSELAEMMMTEQGFTYPQYAAAYNNMVNSRNDTADQNHDYQHNSGNSTSNSNNTNSSRQHSSNGDWRTG